MEASASAPPAEAPPSLGTIPGTRRAVGPPLAGFLQASGAESAPCRHSSVLGPQIHQQLGGHPLRPLLHRHYPFAPPPLGSPPLHGHHPLAPLHSDHPLSTGVTPSGPPPLGSPPLHGCHPLGPLSMAPWLTPQFSSQKPAADALLAGGFPGCRTVERPELTGVCRPCCHRPGWRTGRGRGVRWLSPHLSGTQTGQLLVQPSWFAPGAHLWVLAALGAVWGGWGRGRRNRSLTARVAVLAAVSSRLLRAAVQPCSQGGGRAGAEGAYASFQKQNSTSRHLERVCMVLFGKTVDFYFLPSEGLSFWSCLQG